LTGWPWPLNGVQGFFEGLAETIFAGFQAIANTLADTILPAIDYVATAVWNMLPKWIQDGLLFLSELIGKAWDALWNFIKDPIGTLQAGFNWIVNSLGVTLNVIQTGMGQVAAAVWTVLPDWIRGPIEWLRDLAGRAWALLWDFVHDPIGSIQAGLDTVTTSLSTAFDGAMSTFGSWVSDAMTAVAGALGSAIQGVVDWFSTQIPILISTVVKFAQDHIITPIMGALQWIFGRLADIVGGLISTIEGVFSHHSPITPEQALPIGVMAIVAAVGAGALATGLTDIISSKIVGSGLDLKGLGGYITAVINPSMFMGAVLGVLVGVGIKTPVTHYYNKLFRPNVPDIREAQRMLWRGSLSWGQYMDVVALQGFGGSYEAGYAALTQEIPGAGDLIRFVVREVIDTSVFNENMAYQGFSSFWADAFWEAHWMLPSPSFLVDAMHREIIGRAEYDTFLVLHDYKPEPRPGIGKSDQAIMSSLTKRLIPRVDLRRGYRIGALTRYDLDKRYGWLGYEDDSELMTDIQVGLAFEAERNKLRDNAKTDFVKGYISEGVLRANLRTLGYSVEAVDYYHADALADRERAHKDKVLDIYEDAYTKDLKTYEDLQTDAALIIVDKEALEEFLTAAYIRKFKAPKAA